MRDYRKTDLERFEFAIVIIALALYVAERWFGFALLQGRTGFAGWFESQVKEFLFGQPPYSILNLLLGFDLNQGLFGFLQPLNLFRVVIQAAHFLINYWIVRAQLFFIAGLKDRKTDQ